VLLQSGIGFVVSTVKANRSHRIVTIVMVDQRRAASLERGGVTRSRASARAENGTLLSLAEIHSPGSG
jgi:recombinational DNA repair protein (RecF pathway)